MNIYKGVVLILAATFCIVLMNTCAKMASTALGPIEMVFYRGLIALGLLTPYMILTQPRSVFKTKRIFGIGIFAAIQQVAKTTAYRFAEASLLAPYTYTSIVWATLMGWVIWHDFPALSLLMGTAVVIGCNLIITWREGGLK